MVRGCEEDLCRTSCVYMYALCTVALVNTVRHCSRIARSAFILLLRAPLTERLESVDNAPVRIGYWRQARACDIDEAAIFALTNYQGCGESSHVIARLDPTKVPRLQQPFCWYLIS